MLKNFFFVGLGGGIGSMLRYGAALMIPSRYFLYSTLVVNILGSFFIGLIFALSTEGSLSNNWKLFLAMGICGGFTTFSAFSMENLLLVQNGKFIAAIFYIAISVVAGFSAAWMGYRLAAS